MLGELWGAGLLPELEEEPEPEDFDPLELGADGFGVVFDPPLLLVVW